MNAENVARALEKYPHLKNRVQALLGIVENTNGSLIRADDAELRVIEEVKKLGSEILGEWALNQEKNAQTMAIRENENLIRHSKKNFIG